MNISEYFNKETQRSIYLPEALTDYDFGNNTYVDYVIDLMPLFGFMYEKEISFNNPPKNIKFKSDDIVEETMKLNNIHAEAAGKEFDRLQANILAQTKVIMHLQKLDLDDIVTAYQSDNECYLPLTLTEIDMVTKGHKPYKELGNFTFDNVILNPFENISVRECLLMNIEHRAHSEYGLTLCKQEKILYKELAEIIDIAKKDKVFELVAGRG